MIGYVYLTTNDLNDIKYIGKRQKPKFDKSYKGCCKHKRKSAYGFRWEYAEMGWTV